jgi:hypothetical protein
LPAKIERYDIAKITSNYLASFDRQIAIAYLAIKERNIAESI